MEELSNILSDEKAVVIEAPVEKPEQTELRLEPDSKPAAEPKQDKTERARDETGKFAAKQPEAIAAKPAQPKSEFTDKERAFLATAQEERRKRQDLEKRLQEYENAKTKEPEKPFWEDPDAAINRQKQSQQELVQTVQQMLISNRMSLAEAHAR